MEFKKPEDWLEKELAIMTQEKWDELYIKLIDRYHLPDTKHKLHYPEMNDPKDLAESLKLNRKSCFDLLACNLCEVVKTATYEEARDLLLFALNDDVSPDSAHFLCDTALLALINGLMGESKEAGQINEMFHSVYKWYA